MTMTENPVSSLKFNTIPDHFRQGINVFKWPEEPKKPPNPTAVHLSIDTKGFYLICHDKDTKEIECFDLALIHDTRTGTQVSLPEDAIYCQKINIGLLDVPLKFKCFTIYYGETFVPSSKLRVIHFICESSIQAGKWTEQLFHLGHNQYLRNLSSFECLEKVHSRIVNGLIDSDKQTISVLSLIQFLCKESRDNHEERRICTILQSLTLPHRIDSVIHREQFTFNIFFRFYMHLMERNEIDTLFQSIDDKHQRYLSWENLKEFIKKQNDGCDDPSGIDSYERKAKDLIKRYTQHDEHCKEKGMDIVSFLQYLLSFDNLIIDPIKLGLFMDMNKPLAHYFIASSHNTYLTGAQWNGQASAEMYRQVLLTGCRCIELDVIDSEKKDQPEIRHIYTPVKPVPFIDVILVIRDYAFKVTPYPLILSIENHCGPAAQTTMAKYLVDILGEMLLIEPLKSHPCEEGHLLPSPHDLKKKILIKNKKLQPLPTSKPTKQTAQNSPPTITPTSSDPNTDTSTASSSLDDLLPRCQEINSNPRQGFIFDDDNSSNDNDNDDDKSINDIDPVEIQPSPNTNSLPETQATKAMSDLVHYFVPVRLKNFARTLELTRSYEMSSFPEDKALSSIREFAKDFLAYNQRQISRIYPRGSRIESSNYDPYIYWPVGCQMVALNYQTLDIPMQVNLGLFSFNNACGYIQKPSVLCESRNLFDPRVRRNIENVVGYEIGIKVLSGHFLCENREPRYVDIQMYGMYGDATKRHEYRLRVKQWNGFQAIYDNTDMKLNELPVRFTKIILPEMAAIRFAVLADDGTFIGQCFIPIVHLRTGYRYVVLRNKMNIPVNASSLLIFIQKKIYIDAKDQEFVNLLDNPLKTQCLNSNNDNDNLDTSSASVVFRCHTSSINELGENVSKRKDTILLDETSWFQKHAIAGSYFYNIKELCKVRSLNDIDQKRIRKPNGFINDKLRSISVDYKKKIQKQTDHFDKYLSLQHDRSNSHRSSSKSTNNKINKKVPIQDIEQCRKDLLDLYKNKFDQQIEQECKYIEKFYDAIERKIIDDYNKQSYKLVVILKEEESRVVHNVRYQTEQDKIKIKKAETNKEKMSLMIEESSFEISKLGATTIDTLKAMYENAKEILQRNLQINLQQLEEEKCREIEECRERYSNEYKKKENQIKSHMYTEENDTPPDSSSVSHQSRMTSTSLLASAVEHSASDQHPR